MEVVYQLFLFEYTLFPIRESYSIYLGKIQKLPITMENDTTFLVSIACLS